MHKCSQCGQELEDQFESCWKCASVINAPSIGEERTNRRFVNLALLFSAIFFTLNCLVFTYLTQWIYLTIRPTGPAVTATVDAWLLPIAKVVTIPVLLMQLPLLIFMHGVIGVTIGSLASGVFYAWLLSRRRTRKAQ